MEIAFLVIAVIGLLALTSGSGGGGVSLGIGTTPPPSQPPQPQGFTFTPTPAAPFQVPSVPSQSSNVDGAIFSGGAAIGTAVASQSIKSAGSLLGMSAATAVPVVGAAIAVVTAVAMQLLAAHKARMQGATNENQAVDQYVPVFDSFVKQLTAAYNAKQTTAAQAAQAAQQMDQFIYQKFRSFVGQPGTHWSDSIGMAGQCNSSCTVGCCVYFGDLGPVLNNMSYVLGYPTGKWGQGDPRINGRTITVPKVYPSKYSPYTRELYTITLS